MDKNLFLEVNDQRDPQSMYVGSSLPTWAKACIRKLTPAYPTRVLKE